MKKLLLTIGIVLILVFFFTNINKHFFEFTQNIPILSILTKTINFREFYEEVETTSQNTKFPRKYKIQDNTVQENINKIITEQIAELLNSSEKEKREINEKIQENMQSSLSGTLYGKEYTRIDYDIKYASDEILSFILIKEEGINSTNTEIHTFNYNLKENKEIKLKDLFGNDYKKIINEKIESEILNREEENTNVKFFHKNDMLGIGEDNYFQGISENESFYINEFENVVIIFEKYSIAPGYMERPEFEIVKND